EGALNGIGLPAHPSNLYEPVKYMLDIGGKRIRPAAVLLSNQCFGGDVEKALPAALAVEVFHNFTLMHDDIMDRAPLRRGMVTVHEKWNPTIAILSGDAMMVKAYELIENVDTAFMLPVFRVFNRTALEVCEGQQLDMDFESAETVAVSEYIEMIRLKTAVLLAASLKIGAITAGASEHDQQLIYRFGESLGLAFQLQDDLLDCFADAGKFGKQVGGDIMDNKKTFLMIRARELADETQLQQLNELVSGNDPRKVEQVLALYLELGIDELTRAEIQHYTTQALSALESITTAGVELTPLYQLAELLMVRES
ncbi:MAG: polyprenyl synthetase family protein, partial [Bacteroidota bacterium]